MSYYRLLGFEREPFSTSPDPEFFYSSRGHDRALTNVLIELRLKRGLSVVLGDVGTGKTTLSRKLIQDLKSRGDCIFHMLMDPCFENKTVVLIIDEAQKLTPDFLEEMRLLLNYETNEFKLLQLVLLGQIELLSTIKKISNFFDRISYKTTLEPLDYDETKEMILFRVEHGGFRSKMDLFLEDALREIYQYTNGYPRQVTMMCHRTLKEMIMRKKVVVDREIVRSIIGEDVRTGWQRTDRLLLKNSY